MHPFIITIYVLLLTPMLLLADSLDGSPMTEYLGNRFNYFSRKTRQLGLLFVRRVLQVR